MALSGEIAAIEIDPVHEVTCSECRAVLDVEGVPTFTEADCPSCGHKIVVPGHLGPFRLLRLLGTGGMGAIYHGVDDTLGREVAIKVMLRSLGRDTQLVEVFRREARMAAALNHPNIVQIYSVGQEKEQPYIVMELVTGKSLEDFMAESGPLTEEAALQIGTDVASGLAAGFEIGLIHGDVKPKNILLDPRGTAKVVDFGLATFVDRQAAERGGIWGTPYYIAPERVLKQPVDARSDIYSLGATLYHALAGVPPFDGATPVEVVRARLLYQPKPLTELRESLTARTQSVVMRMLEEKPAKRYPTYASLLGDLRDALQEVKKSTGRLSTSRVTFSTKRARIAKPGEERSLVPADARPIPPAEVMVGAGPSAGPRLIVPRKVRIRSEPVPEEEPDPEAAERARRRGRRTVGWIFGTLAALVALAGLGVAGFFGYRHLQTLKAKRQEVIAALPAVEERFRKIPDTGPDFVLQMRQARDQISAIHDRYGSEKRSKAAALANEALSLMAQAVQKAEELPPLVQRAGEIRAGAPASGSAAEVESRAKAIAEIGAQCTQRMDEIREIRRKVNELLARAHGEQG